MEKKKLNRTKYVLKTIMMNNFAYKVLSLCIAVVAWLVIINIADPITTRSFSGLEVEILNKSAITSINQVYEIVEGRTVDFTVEGKSSVVRGLKLSDFTASADLSMLSPVYAADINVKCTKTDNVDINTKNQMLVVKLEDVETKNVQVTVETVGDVAEGYYVGDYEIKPNMITVSGGESKIKELDSVKVSVDVNGAKKHFKDTYEPIAFDKNGNKIDSSYLTFYNNDNKVSSIDVTVTIYKTKMVPIVIEVEGEPADGYSYSKQYEFTPEEVLIGGSGRNLSEIDSIRIPVDITGASGDYETNVNIEKYVPETVKLVSDVESVSVRIFMDTIIEKTVEYTTSDIEIRNVPEGMLFEYDNHGELMTLALRGINEELEKYNNESIGAYIDLSGKEEGDGYVPIRFENVPADTIISDIKYVKISLKRIDEETAIPSLPENTVVPLPTAVPTNENNNGVISNNTATETPE